MLETYSFIVALIGIAFVGCSLLTAEKMPKMGNLQTWLLGASAFASLWLALVLGIIESSLAKNHYTLLLVSPIIVVALFGISSLALVLYRVYTFNDCDEAAAELKKDIAEAKEDLRRLGFKFKVQEN